MKFLIVDDDDHLLELIEDVLDFHEFSCDTAINGEVAFEKVKNNFYPLIVTDIRMPKMTGTELLKNVREFQKDKEQSKIILMTAYSAPEIQEDIKKWHADGFINKPFDITKFIDTINQVLQDGQESS